MKSKTKNRLKVVPAWIVSGVITMGAIMKICSAAPLVEIYSKIGLLAYLQMLGVIEICLVVLFLIKRTMRLGFLLMTGFSGGAMAVEFSHGAFFIFPALILTGVWISAFLRDPSLFKINQQAKQLSFTNSTAA